MREYEVPTHVQAEDKALLWFTFPQIVAVVAVCAVSYGAFHYLPFGPMGARLAVGVLIGIVAIAMTVGKVGGQGLPLVAADLLKFNLGARRYAGSPSPTGASASLPLRPRPSPTRCGCLAKKAAGGELDKAVKAASTQGASPLPAPQLVRQGPPPQEQRQRQSTVPSPSQHESQHKKHWNRFLAAAALGLLVRVPAAQPASLADGPDDEYPGWRLDEIYFVPPEPVPGRRIFIERLSGHRRHRRRGPAGGPRPGPEGAGLRGPDGPDPEDGGQHQPRRWGRPRATT